MLQPIKHDDRRKTERFTSYRKLFLNVLSCPKNEERTGVTFTCTSVDASRGGVRLLVDKDVPDGSHVEVWVRPLDPPDPLAFRAQVVWCRQAKETGLYWLGLELSNEQSKELEVWQGLFDQSETG